MEKSMGKKGTICGPNTMVVTLDDDRLMKLNAQLSEKML
jgi:hypothetical protein